MSSTSFAAVVRRLLARNEHAMFCATNEQAVEDVGVWDAPAYVVRSLNKPCDCGWSTDAAALTALGAELDGIVLLMQGDHDLDADEFAHQYNNALHKLAAGYHPTAEPEPQG